jgi:hypothetical protein
MVNIGLLEVTLYVRNQIRGNIITMQTESGLLGKFVFSFCFDFRSDNNLASVLVTWKFSMCGSILSFCWICCGPMLKPSPKQQLLWLCQRIKIATVPGIREGRIGESIVGVNSSMIYLMQCKNLWKCYNVLSPSITTTKVATTQ